MKDKEIKKWLIDQPFGQDFIAYRAGVSAGFVTRLIKGERGKRQGPKAIKVLRVLKKLGCPEEFLSAEVNHA